MYVSYRVFMLCGVCFAQSLYIITLFLFFFSPVFQRPAKKIYICPTCLYVNE